jgi:hypothetical protein
LKKLKHRYQQLGFEGPLSFTTDQCCHEKNFLEKTLGLNSGDAANNNVENETGEAMETYEVVSMPSPPRVASTVVVADLFVGDKLADISLTILISP